MKKNWWIFIFIISLFVLNANAGVVEAEEYIDVEGTQEEYFDNIDFIEGENLDEDDSVFCDQDNANDVIPEENKEEKLENQSANTDLLMSPITSSEDFVYQVLGNGTIEITNIHFNSTYDLMIPEEIDGYQVSRIGSYILSAYEEAGESFRGKLVLPDTVEYIGDYAFYGGGFRGDLVLPKALKHVGKEPFGECGFDGKLVLNENLVEIDDYAFVGLPLQGSLKLPDSLFQIGKGAFLDTKFTGDLIIPDSVQFIGEQAFAYSDFNGKLKLSNGLTKIEDKTFAGCAFMGDLIIPDNVIEIGISAFEYTGYNNEGQFNGDAILPLNLKCIGENAFNGCKFESKGMKYVILDNGCIEIIGIVDTHVENLEVPSKINGTSVMKIGDRAFYDCSVSKDIIVDTGIQYIGEEAFAGCGASGDIVLPAGIQYIGYCAFRGVHMQDIIGDFIIPDLPQNVRADIFADQLVWSQLEWQLNFEGDLGVGQIKQGKMIGKGIRVSYPIIMEWYSSDDAVATVTSDGTITARSVGKVTITAKFYNGQEQSAVLNVVEDAVDISDQEFILYTSPSKKEFSNLWKGDCILIGTENGGEGRRNHIISKVEEIGENRLLSCKMDQRFSDEEIWKVICNNVGNTKIKVYFKDNLIAPKEIALCIQEKKGLELDYNDKIKIGEILRQDYYVKCNNLLYGGTSAVYVKNEDINKFYQGNLAWGGWFPEYNRQGSTHGIMYLINQKSKQFLTYPIYPGDVELMFYYTSEDYANGNEAVAKFKVNIEKPVINSNFALE